MSKVRFVRDPVHNLIRINDPLVVQLIDTVAFQRLRRIRQLGLAWLVYPGAEHSRFSHALGAYHLSQRVVDHLSLQPSGECAFDEDTRRLVLVAALLHDIGHGPFSHLFESVFRDLGNKEAVDHEAWTRMILQEDEEVKGVLQQVDPFFPKRVCDVRNHTHEPRYVSDLVSSQMDVDRFDYLLRDTHMTGAQYGRFDSEWLLRSLTLAEVKVPSPFGEVGDAQPVTTKTIAIETRRGMNVLEQHLLGRHYMYRQVYYHKTIRAAEGMLRLILKRASALVRSGGSEIGGVVFQKLAKGEGITTEEYLTMNDFLILAWIDEWAASADQVLSDLAMRLRKRDLFGTIVIPEEWGMSVYSDKRQQARDYLQQQGLDPRYYFIEDEPSDITYKDFFWYTKKGKQAQEIWCVEDDKVYPITAYRGLLTQAKHALEYDENRWYVPKEHVRRIRVLVGMPAAVNPWEEGERVG